MSTTITELRRSLWHSIALCWLEKTSLPCSLVVIYLCPMRKLKLICVSLFLLLKGIFELKPRTPIPKELILCFTRLLIYQAYHGFNCRYGQFCFVLATRFFAFHPSMNSQRVHPNRRSSAMVLGFDCFSLCRRDFADHQNAGSGGGRLDPGPGRH